MVHNFTHAHIGTGGPIIEWTPEEKMTVGLTVSEVATASDVPSVPRHDTVVVFASSSINTSTSTAPAISTPYSSNTPGTTTSTSTSKSSGTRFSTASSYRVSNISTTSSISTSTASPILHNSTQHYNKHPVVSSSNTSTGNFTSLGTRNFTCVDQRPMWHPQVNLVL